MTFVGKILVIVIMVFALFFLAVSTMVFTTEKNWKDEATKQKTSVTKLQTDINALKAQITARETDLANAKKAHETDRDAFKKAIDRVEDETKQARTQLAAQIKSVETAQENVKAAQGEAADRVKEATTLREQVTGLQKEANDLKLRQTELNDLIRTLQRDNDVANSNNVELRRRVAAYTGELRRLGRSTDVNQLQGGVSTPKNDVEGEVTKVDARNSRLELSIGADDGLAVGNEMDIYRLKPTPEYIGRVRIEAVDNDHSVGRVVGNTVRGIKIKEHDIVSTKIRARS